MGVKHDYAPLPQEPLFCEVFSKDVSDAMGAEPACLAAPYPSPVRRLTKEEPDPEPLPLTPGTMSTDDIEMGPMIYGGDFAWVGKLYKLRIPPSPSPLQWLNGVTKRLLHLEDIVFWTDGTFRRPGNNTPIFPIQGIDLRWRWDAALDRLVIDFWHKEKLQAWRWDELQITDKAKKVPDFTGVGHVGKFTFKYELLGVTVGWSPDLIQRSTECRLILNLEAVTKDGRTFPWWFKAAKKIRKKSGIDAMGSFFATPPMQAQLGAGSYGAVWLARHRKTQQLFAVKNMAVPRRVSVASAIAQNELEMAEKLNMEPHPCIVGLFAVEYFEIQHSALYMLIMEFCSGGDLQEALNKQVGVDMMSYKPPQEALRWIGQIFLGVEHIHTKLSLLVRDLKPGNVVISDSRGAKLTDFGCGRVMADPPGGEWTFETPPGTPGFIAPEVLAQQPYSYPADVYSLGVLTWVTLSGGLKGLGKPLPPTAGWGQDFRSYSSDWKLLHDAMRRPGSAKALLPASAGDFIAAVTHERPEHRPDCQELRTYKFFFEQCLPEAFRGVW